MTEIKALTKDDRAAIAAIAEIERLCFSEPWSEGSLEILTREGAVGFAAVVDGIVAAYGGMMCVLDEGQITNIATHPGFRRRGLGREVVSALAEYARANGIASIFLEVRESNTAARALYTACGYREIGRRRRFYRNPAEDAVLMECKIV